MVYPFQQKELEIKRKIFPLFLLLFLTITTFQWDASADEKRKTALDYRAQGYEEQQKGNWTEAMTYYGKALSLGLDTAELHNDMGVGYEQLGDLNRAEESYLAAFDKNKDYLPTYMNLACLYERKGNVTKAAEYFQKRLEMGDEDDPWTTKAEDGLRRLADKAPAVKQWLDIRDQERAKRQQELSASQELSEQVISSEHHFRRAQGFEQQEKYSQSLEEYNKALAYTPYSPKILKARKGVLYKMSKQQVKEHVDSAMKFLNMGDTSSAKVEFRNILTIIPNEPMPVLE